MDLYKRKGWLCCVEITSYFSYLNGVMVSWLEGSKLKQWLLVLSFSPFLGWFQPHLLYLILLVP